MVKRAYGIYLAILGSDHPNTKTVLAFLHSWDVKP